MPITKELENIRKFESVGFTHEQAEILAETLEQSHADGQQLIKDSLHKEIDDFRKEIRNEFKEIRNEIVNSELRIKASHTDLLMKIFGIAVGCTSIAIAISKVWK